MNIIFFEKNSNEKVQLQPHAKHTITAKAGDVYQLIDSDTQLSPLDIQAHRKSDDLILSSKEQNIEVVIKDFWQECQPGEQQCYTTLNVLDSNGVMGQATITQDGPVLEHLVAGETGTLSDNDDGIGLFLWVAGSIGSALAIFLANRNHGGDNNKGNEADITAPSKPGLTAEDDGSVSIDLPKDANKGDSVDVTFEDEDGNSNTVTLEKGDNGWTSSDPELIPDTDNNQVTIPNDKIKDNSDVTASAKDPSGNKSDDVTVTAKPDPVSDMPVLSIPEVDDGYANAEELKDGLQAEVTLPAGTVEGAEITLTVTRPDNTTETITYTVTKDDVAAGKISIDIPKDAVQNGQNSVDVSLTQGNNPAKPGNKVDFAVDGQIPGDTDGDGTVDTTPVVTIPEAADGVNADELKDGVQTQVTVPGGSAAGDTLTLTITKPDGSTDTVEHTLTADEVTAGKADVTIPADKVTADGNYSVTAEITDPAGNTSGQGKPTDFAVDTVAPSAPVLKAEDDGSVSVDLPTDANKGDTVEITFEDEKGDKHTVTLEKGDNGWTSDTPALIPDSNGDKATIPADNIKDNSDVTGIAKDPSGNESDPSTVTSKTDGVADAPVLTIPEVADGYANADELKDGLQAEVTLPAGTVEGAEITLTVTRPDKTTETVTHTVTKDEAAAGKASVDIPKDAVQNGQNSVDVSLTQGNNPA
ncbi:RTX toxin, partial [Klebsiella pneumoniae subsp. pneumoniae]|nr:RTX toxin [Klebsiella pneumoniae subsp. pneumoniae]